MSIVKFTFWATLFFAFSSRLNAQSYTCPPNLDFESGNFNYWELYTGSCCPILTITMSGPVAGRHTITSGTGVDPFGGFPVVAPGGGVYSLKLGNSSTGRQAERARYWVHVPAGVNNYSVIFRYAVVFEDPGHLAVEQPRFEVKAIDSLTGNIIPCSDFTYIATSSLPGFSLSNVGSDVWYKSWTTASINLSGYAGRTVAVDFASGDCDLGAHFGYGYVDLNCGLFAVNSITCASTPTVTLSAPPGFQSYTWKDSTTWVTVGTGQNVTIATPATSRTYAVILTPYTGFGCPDTLYTHVTVSSLNVNAGNDTIKCGTSTGVQLNATVGGNTGTTTYLWSPSTGLSCTTCANPIANPTVTTKYAVTVNDANGCSKTDSVVVNVSSTNITLTPQNVSCYGAANGSITTVVTGTKPPFTYSWNTTPVQTTANATNLPPGTYTITVTDSIGCTKTANASITQPTALATSLSKIDALCNGTAGSATVTPSGGTAPYTYSWNTTPVQTGATATNLPTGTYIVQTTDARSCTKYDTISIIQTQAMGSSVSKSDVLCNGGNTGSATVTVTGGISPRVYSWNTSPVQTTNAATGLTAGTYVLTTTDSIGCSRRDTVVIGQPTALNSSTAKTDVSCYGLNNGTAGVTASGGTTPYTYSWNTTPVQTTATITGLAPGTYISTITDANGCTKRDTIIINQPTALNTLTSNTTLNCFGNTNATASVSATGGTSPYTYSWNTTPVQTTTTATALGAGTYVVTSSDAHGCIKRDTLVISQPPLLTSARSSTNVNCFGGNNGTATVAPTGGTSPYTYSWNTTPAQTTATAVNLSAGTYIATITDSKGCIKLDTLIITAPAVLSASLSKTDVSCFGGNNGVATATPSGGTAPYTYNWNTMPVKTTASATALTAGTYIVTITDSKGCFRLDTITITQPTPLTATISSSFIPCFEGTNGTATVVPAGGTQPYTYSWNTKPAQTGSTATNLGAGVYSVVVTDAKGCTTSIKDTVKQSTPIVITAQQIDKSCPGYSNSSAKVTITGGQPSYTVSWNTVPVQTNTTAVNLSGGTYVVTVTDANGCTKTETVAIQDYPSPNVDAGPDLNICKGASVTLSATGAIKYAWSPSKGMTCNSCPSTIAYPDGNMTYQVIGIDSNNCHDTDYVDVNIIPRHNVSVSPDVDICLGDTVQLLANGGVKYTWSPNIDLTDNTIHDPKSYTKETIRYKVVIVQNECYSDTLYQEVRVHPVPTVNAGPDMSGIPGASFQINAVASGYNTIAWVPTYGLSCDNCLNPTARVDRTITYVIKVTNNFGCEAQDDVTIKVSCDESEFFMPNTFTPNGDGSNDRFWPLSKNTVNVNHFAIYNRWGEVVFEANNFPSNDPNYGWDGTYKNMPLSPDVFVYVLETKCTNGERIFIKGDISIVK